MTSFDFSAVLRQGGFLGMAHPIIAAKNIGPMLLAFKSEQHYRKLSDAIQERANAPLYYRAKLALADADGKLSAHEEVYMSRLVERVPFVRASERAYTAYLNLLRADVFDAMTAALCRHGAPTMAEMEAIANFINVATGRGSLGSMDKAIAALGPFFFAPRYTASRFQLLFGQPLYHGSLRTRMTVAREYAKVVIGMGLIHALFKAFGGDDEWDWRSTNIGKLRFGVTRLDPMFGLSQTLAFIGRLANQQVKTQEGLIVRQGIDSTIGRFARSKFSPLSSFAYDVISGKDYQGNDVTITGLIGNLTIPLSMRDISRAMEEQGIAKGTVFSMLSLFGWGLQTYGDIAYDTDMMDANTDFSHALLELRAKQQEYNDRGEPFGLDVVMVDAFEKASAKMTNLRDEAVAAATKDEQTRLLNEAKDIATTIVQGYRDNPQPDKVIAEVAAKRTTKAVSGLEFPTPIASRERIETAKEFQERVEDWQDARDAQDAWLRKNQDNPIVRHQIALAIRKSPKQPRKSLNRNVKYNERYRAYLERRSRWMDWRTTVSEWGQTEAPKQRIGPAAK
jgi:hypothetical protein